MLVWSERAGLDFVDAWLRFFFFWGREGCSNFNLSLVSSMACPLVNKFQSFKEPLKWWIKQFTVKEVQLGAPLEQSLYPYFPIENMGI